MAYVFFSFVLQDELIDSKVILFPSAKLIVRVSYLFAIFKNLQKWSYQIISQRDVRCIKGQLQRFHKLIFNDRIWPSEHGFEVIFEKSLFVFEISAFKVRNKRGIYSRFHSFSENNSPETFVCDVTSDKAS